MSKVSDLLTRAEKLSKVIRSDSSFNEYSAYKNELEKKVLLSNDNNLNVKVADAVDKIFASSALCVADDNKEIFKSDVYEVIIDNNINNEVMLYSIVLTMLLKYYNLNMATIHGCKESIYQVCDNIAKSLASDIVKQI